MLSVIGKGSYGKVILVKKNDTGELYAMKVLKKSEILKRNQVEHTMTERRILVSWNDIFWSEQTMSVCKIQLFLRLIGF